MTPDTCPHCGAPLLYKDPADYTCGTWFTSAGFGGQGDLCARYVRTRINELEWMADAQSIHDAFHRHVDWIRSRGRGGRSSERTPWDKLVRFRTACLREIDRLRGGA